MGQACSCREVPPTEVEFASEAPKMGQACSCRQVVPPTEVEFASEVSAKVTEQEDEATTASPRSEEEVTESRPVTPGSIASSFSFSNVDGSAGVAEQFRALVLAGRLAEAEHLAMSNECEELDADLLAWMKETLEMVRWGSANVQLPGGNDGWNCITLADLKMKVYFRRHDCIDIRMVVDLPGTLEQLLAINWEPDLAVQWLPFSPKVEATKSQRTPSVLMRVTAKLPVLAGTREVYVYRTLVDCFAPGAEVAGRRGLMVIECSPENWRTGGLFQGEFHVLPPSQSRWVTRDEQKRGVTFYEVLDPSTVRTVISYQLVFNVPHWLLPDAALSFLAKVTAKQWQAGIVRALSDFDRLGYAARVANGSHQLYSSIPGRAQS